MCVCMRHARYAISADKLDSRRWSTRCYRTDRRENFTSIKGKITVCKLILYASFYVIKIPINVDIFMLLILFLMILTVAS